MELTATSIVSLFDTTKEQRQSFADFSINAIKEGNVNPLDFHLQLKKMEDTIKQIVSHPEYMSLVLDEAEKNGKSFEKSHAKIEIKEVGTKYDYTVCEDNKINELSESKADIDKKIKERQKFLQLIPDGGTVDPENGNMVYRASKSSTTSVVVTLK